jgi:hypothetical protein
MAWLQKIFTDKRICATLVVGWCCIIVGLLVHTSVLVPVDSQQRVDDAQQEDSDKKASSNKAHQFWSLGPNSDTMLLNIRVDTWRTWWGVAICTWVGTVIHEFIVDAISPWMQNSIQDHKAPEVPYGSRLMCQGIVLVFTFYSHLSMFAFLLLYTTQVDFLIIRLLADLFVTSYSTHLFLRGKSCTPGAGGQGDAATGVASAMHDIETAFVLEESCDLSIATVAKPRPASDHHAGSRWPSCAFQMPPKTPSFRSSTSSEVMVSPGGRSHRRTKPRGSRRKATFSWDTFVGTMYTSSHKSEASPRLDADASRQNQAGVHQADEVRVRGEASPQDDADFTSSSDSVSPPHHSAVMPQGSRPVSPMHKVEH